MRIGICTGGAWVSVKQLELIAALGFDYIEGNTSEILSLSKDEFNNFKNALEKLSIKCEVFYVFFPYNMKVVGDEANMTDIFRYIEEAIERAVILGVKLIVIGSGMSRFITEGFNIERAVNQFVNVVRYIGEETSKYNIETVIEPISKKETNLINTIKEAHKFAKLVNHPNVKIMADFYHILSESEDINILEDCKEILQHVHISSNLRTFPMYTDTCNYYELFFKLSQIGYKQRISIEASTSNLEEEGKTALNLIRSLTKEENKSVKF